MSRFKSWIFLPSVETAGEILLAWNMKRVTTTDSLLGKFFISIKIQPSHGNVWWLTGVYSPNQPIERKRFWKELAGLFGLYNPNWCIGRDFNVIRFLSEKSNRGRVTRSTRDINCFIRETSLKDPTLQGADFTWSNCRVNLVYCRLDRFLYSVRRRQ